MIYLISNNILKDSLPNIKYISVEESLKYLELLEWVSVDIETTGLDRFTDKILLLQLGDEYNQYVIDITTIDIQFYKQLLETKNLILQGTKFDLQFFYIQKIIPRGKIWDTMLAEQVLYNGYKPIANLEFLSKKYCTVLLNKAEAINFTKQNYILNKNSIEYAAKDIEVLSIIKQKQIEKANKKDVILAIKLENEFVKVLAYVEYCGIHLDVIRWKKKYQSAGEKLKILTKKLNQYIINNNMTEFINKQLDLFSSDLFTIINWNSSKQVLLVFKSLGINITTKDNKSGESISEKIIAKQKNLFPIIPIYLEYQIIKKDFSTYGESFLSYIHPSTGRIHANFIQLTVTSRLSCSNPNLQNLPKDKRTRSCITAVKGNILVDCDYKAQEDVIFVNNSLEPKMIEFYKNPLADGHSYVASLCFPKQLKNVPLKNIKSKFPKLREEAKTAKFAIHYGGTGYTIARNLNISEERGNEIEKAYLTAFPDIRKYLKHTIILAKKRKYVLTSRITKRKFWADEYEEMTFYEQKEFAKKGNNYPIQTESAELTKIGLIYFFNWILDNNYFDLVKIVNTIHDEVLTEQPIELTDIIAKNLKECLEKGAEPYCKVIPLVADVEISNHWVH